LASRALHSFPTRRSSDLGGEMTALGMAPRVDDITDPTVRAVPERGPPDAAGMGAVKSHVATEVERPMVHDRVGLAGNQSETMRSVGEIDSPARGAVPQCVKVRPAPRVLCDVPRWRDI